MRRLLVVPLLLAACSKDFSLPPVDPASSPGQIRVAIAVSSARADFQARVRSLRLTASAPNSPDVSAIAAADATLATLTVAGSGARTVTAVGLDSAGAIIYRGDAESVQVEAGKITEARVVLNGLPIVGLVVIKGDTGLVGIDYTLADPENDPSSILVEYLGGERGLFFGPAAVASAASVAAVLPGPRTLQWSSHADEPGQSAVYAVRLTPYDSATRAAARTGLAGTSPYFLVDNSPPHDVSIVLAGGKAYTRDRNVEVALAAQAASFVRLSEAASDLDAASERVLAARLIYTFPGADGPKTIHARFRGAGGAFSDAVQASVILDSTAPGCHGDAASDPTACSSIALLEGTARTRNASPTLKLVSKGADFVRLSVNDPSFSSATPNFFAATLPLDLRTPGVPIPADGTYRVYALFSDQAGNSDTALFTFALDRTPPRPPQRLVYPQQNRRMLKSRLDFIWDPSLDASSEALTYRLRVGYDPFCTVVDAGKDVSGLTDTVTDFGNMNGGTWYWCVTALDGAANESVIAGQGFTIDNSAPTLLPVLSPTNRDRPLLGWRVTQPAGGRFHVSLTGPTAHEGESSSDGFLPPPLADGVYTWNVARYQDDSQDLGPEAAIAGTFTVDTAPPSGPDLIEPAPAALLASETVAFAWTPSSDPAGGPVRHQLRVRPRGPGVRGFVVDDNVDTATEVVRSLPDGSFEWWVTAVDLAGNSTDSEVRVFDLDTHAPPAPVLQGFADEVTREPRPRFTVNVFEPSEVQVRYVRSTDARIEILSTTALNPGSLGLTAESDLSDTVYTAYAASIDGAGNSAKSGTISFRVDTTAPAPPSLVLPLDDSLRNAASVTFSWTASAGVGAGGTYLLQVRSAIGILFVDQEGLRVTTWPASLPDGAYTWTVTAVDLAGNSTASEERTLTVDTEPPQTPSLQSFEGNSVRTRRPRYNVVSFEASRILVRTWQDGSAQTDESAVDAFGGLVHVDAASDLADGDYHALAVARDVAGNEALSPQMDFTVDTTVPTGPTQLTPAHQSFLASGAVTLTWNEATDPGRQSVSYEVRINSGGNAGVQLSSSRSSLLVNLPDDDYNWTVQALDAAGNVSTERTPFAFTVDTLAPVPPEQIQVTERDGTPFFREDVITDPLPRFVLDAFDPRPKTMIVRYARDAVTEEASTDWRAGQTTYVDVQSALVEGSYRAVAIAVDKAGNRAESQARTFLVDFAPPSMPALADPAEGTVTSVGDVLFRWGAATDSGPGAPRYLVAMQSSFADLPCPAPRTDFLEKDLVDGTSESRVIPEGAWCWTVFAVDSAGHVSQPSAQRRLIIDTQRPAQPLLQPLEGSTAVVARPIFAIGQIDQDVKVLHLYVYEGNGTLISDSTTEFAGKAPALVQLQVQTSLQDGQTYSLYASAVDRAGNVGLDSAAISVRVDLVPAAPAKVRLLFDAPSVSGGGAVTQTTIPTYLDASVTVAYINDLKPTLVIVAGEQDPYNRAFLVTVLREDGTTEGAPRRETQLNVPLNLSNGRWRFRVVATRDTGFDSPPTYAEAQVGNQGLATTTLFHVYRGPPSRTFGGIASAAYEPFYGCGPTLRMVNVSWALIDADPGALFPPLRKIRVEPSSIPGGQRSAMTLAPNATSFSQCLESGDWTFWIYIVDAAGNESSPVASTFTVDALAPFPIDAASPLDGDVNKAVALEWARPEQSFSDIEGYLITLQTDMSTDRWTCAGAFCSTQASCATDPSSCVSSLRCPQAPLVGTRACVGYDSFSNAEAPSTYCTFPLLGVACATSSFVFTLGWECTTSSTGSTVNCTYHTTEAFSPSPPFGTRLLDLPFVIPDLPYRWNVQAHDLVGNLSNLGKEGRFTVDRHTPAPPVPQLPAPGWRTNRLFPSFVWNNPAVSEERNPTQTLEICLEQGATFPIVSSQILTGPWTALVTHSSSVSLPEGSLRWRPIITDAAGNESSSADNCADAQTLIVDRTAPPAPSLLTPTGGMSQPSGSQTLTWTREEGASTYLYFIWKQSTGLLITPGGCLVTQPPGGITVTASTGACPGGVTSGTWIWRVQAIEQLDDGQNVSLSPAGQYIVP